MVYSGHAANLLALKKTARDIQMVCCVNESTSSLNQVNTGLSDAQTGDLTKPDGVDSLVWQLSSPAERRALVANQSGNYTVQSGDTLSSIAADHGVSLANLIAANPQISNPDVIYPDQSINIPSNTSSTYTVASGDTLSGIAGEHGISLQALLAANPQIVNPDRIYPGDKITIPSTGQVPPQEPGSSTPVPGNPGGSPVFDYNMIAGVEGNPNVTQGFISEVEAMAGRLGTRPEYILAVISFETGGTFSPSIRNSIGATGLIQFLPSTARGLGTSTDALARMSATEQLQYVEKYFSQSRYDGKLGTVEGLYSAVLSGTATPDADDTLINFVQGHRNYEQNKGLDFNRDGRITSGEAAAAVTSRLYGGVREVQQQLIAAGAVPASEQAGFADGSFGPATSRAISNFQAQQGLTVTGLLNDATGRALFGLDGTATAPTVPSAPANDLQLSQAIHERSTPNRQYISSPVIGDFTITEGFMARGGPHSSKSAANAIYSDNPGATEFVPAGVYNLGIDYVTANGRIQSWFDGEVVDIINSNSGYGNSLIMKSDQTYTYQGQEYAVYAHYAHADSFNVAEGDRISAGQDIGDQGSTGHSTGDHVDFLTWINVGGERIFISPNLLSGGN